MLPALGEAVATAVCRETICGYSQTLVSIDRARHLRWRQVLTREYRTDDWQEYRIEYSNPHLEVESPEREIDVVDGALRALEEAGILANGLMLLEQPIIGNRKFPAVEVY